MSITMENVWLGLGQPLEHEGFGVSDEPGQDSTPLAGEGIILDELHPVADIRLAADGLGKVIE
ncbi:MAG TPA: hypothetical protein VLG37_02215 [Candidatus Saccharimonadales bacterium]|nr:hypothetical protein [Candidatus Saccharimonadales bacterium]